MPKVTFVIGATASGKTYYINHIFADKNVEILNIYDYQQKAYEESGYGQMMPIPVQFRCLMKANDDLLSDIIENLKQGNDVVAEQTSRKLPIVNEAKLNENELATWRRIKGEPESLLEEEKD